MWQSEGVLEKKKKEEGKEKRSSPNIAINFIDRSMTRWTKCERLHTYIKHDRSSWAENTGERPFLAAVTWF